MTSTMPSIWLYRRTEPTLWTVGFYTPAGTWEPETDHGTADEAAARVHWLNGGTAPDPAPIEHRVDVDEDDDDEGCQGHESLDGAHMGETVYCDGTCRR